MVSWLHDGPFREARYVAVVAACLLGAHAVRAELPAEGPPAEGTPALWDRRPVAAPAPKAELPPSWRSDASSAGAGPQHQELPDAWAMPPSVSDAPAGATVGEGTLAKPTENPQLEAPNASTQSDPALLEGARTRLRNLGFLAPTDGDDTALSEAIRRFQASINIPATGVLDRDTLGRLLVP